MLVSIIIPVYQGSKFLRETVASVRSQTVESWELIIVDDGSTDDSFDVACELAALDKRITAIKKPNGGVASARNFGYLSTHSSSEFVAFLDQDDLWEPSFLSRSIAMLTQKLEYSASHCLVRQIDSAGLPSGGAGGRVFGKTRRKVVGGSIVDCASNEPTTFDSLISDNWIPTPGAALIRRSAFEKLEDRVRNYFDPAMGSSDDWDLWIRLSLIGDIGLIDDILMGWRIHDANNSSNVQAAIEAEFRARKKAISLPGLTETQRIQAIFRYRKAICSAHLTSAIYHVKSAKAYALGGKLGRFTLSLVAIARSVVKYLSLRLVLNQSQTLPDMPNPSELHRPWPPK